MSARKRFTDGWQFFASYLWSELEGNYDGVFQASTGQLDPNINSAFDYADFLINADGKLSNDREHSFKAQGSYVVQDGALDGLNIGASGYFQTGTPLTAYGYSFLYSNWEYYLTPRGSLGENPDEYEVDLHLGYPIKLGRQHVGSPARRVQPARPAGDHHPGPALQPESDTVTAPASRTRSATDGGITA